MTLNPNRILLIIILLFVLNLLVDIIIDDHTLWYYNNAFIIFIIIVLFMIMPMISSRFSYQELHHYCLYSILIFIPLIYLYPLYLLPMSLGKFDVWAHLSFAKAIKNSGHILYTGIYANEYEAAPGIQISLVILSFILNISLISTTNIHYIVIILHVSLLIYVITTRFVKVFKVSSKQFYAIFPLLYFVFAPYVSGYNGTLATMPLCIILYWLIVLDPLIFNKCDLKHIILYIVFLISLLFSHFVNYITMLIIILVSLIYTFFREKMQLGIVRNDTSYKYLNLIAMFSIVIFFLHLVYQYHYGIDVFSNFVNRLINTLEKENTLMAHYQEGLQRVGLYAKIITGIMVYGKYLSLILYFILNIILVNIVRKERLNNYYEIMLLLLPLLPNILIFIVTSILYNIKVRFLYIVGILLLFSSPLMFNILKSRNTKIKIIVIMIMLLYVLSLPSNLLIQPLIPKVDSGYVIDIRRHVTISEAALASWLSKYYSPNNLLMIPYTSWLYYYYISQDLHKRISYYLYDRIEKYQVYSETLMIYFYPSDTFSTFYKWKLSYDSYLISKYNIVYNIGDLWIFFIKAF